MTTRKKESFPIHGRGNFPTIIFSVSDRQRPFTIRTRDDTVYLSVREARLVRRMLSRMLFQCTAEGD